MYKKKVDLCQYEPVSIFSTLHIIVHYDKIEIYSHPDMQVANLG